MTAGCAVETHDLTKKFKELVAVDCVNLKINYGEIFGLLGPNGAGKTTLIHMLCTILPCTSGVSKVAGFDTCRRADSVRGSIGIVFQEPSLDNRLTGKENLDFHGRMYGMLKMQREERIKEVLSIVGLNDRANSLVQTYSGGMKRRLEIARGLMHRPKILFLDEPTLGLDPQTRRVVWEQVKSLNEREKITIMLTTHYIEEADFLCDRVAIIDSGAIVALGEPEKLKDKLKGDIVSLKVSDVDRFLSILQKSSLVKEAKLVGDKIHLQVSNGGKALPKLIDVVKSHGGQVLEASLSRPTLEDVFIKYTGKAIREEEQKGSARMHFGMGATWRR
jgi:ABC-2 type transport system ATP-binding protein